MLTIVEVRGWRRLRDFLRLPHRIYGDGSPWVPPLDLQLMIQLGNPFDKSRRLLLALDGSRVVGRIGVKIHQAESEAALHFGFFECMEGYPDAAEVLIEKAHQLAPDLTMLGPFNFRMEDPYTGLLVDGFSERPTFWSAYNPPYYVEYLSRAGLNKVMDLFTYRFDWERVETSFIERLAGRARERGIELRSLDPRNRVKDIRKVAKVMNEALKDNWGFEVFTEEQVRELTVLSYLFLEPYWLTLAEKSEQAVGCAIVLPDFNPWLKETNGRLTPWLIWKILFCKKELTSMRAWALGVLSQYRRGGAAFALLWDLIERGRDWGVTEAEVSWILETNLPMNAIMEKAGLQRNRVHRILQREPLRT
jgi:GNAT superfamily N-acetyltransferase